MALRQLFCGVGLLSCWTLGMCTGWADTGLAPSSPQSCERVLRKIISHHEFSRYRGLAEYVTMLGKPFFNRLVTLGNGAHWIDAGAGEARAVLQYVSDAALRDELSYARHEPGSFRNMIERFHYGKRLTKLERDIYLYFSSREMALPQPGIDRATVTAISYKMENLIRPRGAAERRRFRVFCGRFFERIPLQQLLVGAGPADVITDVFGVFAYTAHPDVVLGRYIQLLKPDGTLYIYWGRGKDPEHLRNHVVNIRPGKKITLLEWLEGIPGIQVRTQQSRLFGLPRTDSVVISVMDKSAVQIPPVELVGLITRVGRKDLTVPQRVFRQIP